jgi:hypothetical protein
VCAGRSVLSVLAGVSSLAEEYGWDAVDADDVLFDRISTNHPRWSLWGIGVPWATGCRLFLSSLMQRDRPLWSTYACLDQLIDHAEQRRASPAECR